MARLSLIIAALAVSTIPLVNGCQTLYYETMESFGQHKRDILVSRVESARDGQEEAKEEFRSALDQFSAVVTFEGGDLREKYDDLSAALARSEGRAEAVHDRVGAVEDVAEALFREWEQELNQYSSDDLRRRSERKLRDTRDRYEQLLGAMRRAEGKMEPVLTAFRDQVLFLKHNLNAQAVASLQDEVVTLESEVADLIAEMERAIAEADAFISSLSTIG